MCVACVCHVCSMCMSCVYCVYNVYSDYTIHPSHGLLEDCHQVRHYGRMHTAIPYMVLLQVFIISTRCCQSNNNQHVIKAVLNGSDKYTEVFCCCCWWWWWWVLYTIKQYDSTVMIVSKQHTPPKLLYLKITLETCSPPIYVWYIVVDTRM